MKKMLVILGLLLCASAVQADGYNVGDHVNFGRYEQDNDPDNGPEEIEWRVIDVWDDMTLLLSENCLRGLPYNKELKDCTWEEAWIRTWLNGEFYQEAFSEEEQEEIVTVKVRTPINPKHRLFAGNDTEDKLFLLSEDEARNLIASDEDRRARVTRYAYACGAWTYDIDTHTVHAIGPVARDAGMSDGSFDPEYSEEATAFWWTRTPGEKQSFVCFVEPSGEVNLDGYAVRLGRNQYGGVRPVMWVTLTK